MRFVGWTSWRSGVPPPGHGYFTAGWWWRWGAVSLVRWGQRCSSSETRSWFAGPVTLLAGLGSARTRRALRPGSDSSLGGPARPASRRSPRSPAWSRVGAGKLRSPTLRVVSCISSRLPGLSATISQLTGFISAPCTNAPNQKGKSGDCPPFRGCCLKFLV